MQIKKFNFVILLWKNILIIIQTIELELIFVCTIINDVYIVTLISGPFGFSKCVYSVV